MSTILTNKIETKSGGLTLDPGAGGSVTVEGTVTGTLSATSVLADGVIATTQATSDNSTKVATTAFVKSVVTAEDLDIAGDTGTGAVDLDSQTLTIRGTSNEIETSVSGQTVTIGLPSTITANVTGNVSGNLTGTVLTAAQTNITSLGTLSSLAVSGAASTGVLTAASSAGGTSAIFKNNGVQDANGIELRGGTTGSTVNWAIKKDETVAQALQIFPSTANGGTTYTTPAVTLLSSGNLGIGTAAPAEKLHIGSGNIKLDNGYGIDFSASAGGGATSSLLDDYEEGTFTPSVVYSTSGTPTYATRLGRYTKVGRMVQVQIYINFNENGALGFVSITGLPFTAVNSLARAIPSIMSFGLTGLPTAVSITGIVAGNTTDIVLFLDNNAATNLSDTYTDNDQDILLALTYEAA